jgi:hypothetical protein
MADTQWWFKRDGTQFAYVSDDGKWFYSPSGEQIGYRDGKWIYTPSGAILGYFDDAEKWIFSEKGSEPLAYLAQP